MSITPEKLLQSLSLCTKSNVGLYDKHSHMILSSGVGKNPFCYLLHGSKKACERCLAFDDHAFSVVEASHLTTSFTCPFGISCTVAPIVAHNELTGYLYLAHGLDQQDAPQKQLRAALDYTDNEFSPQALLEALNQTQQYSREELDAFRVLTDVYAKHISSARLFHDRPTSVPEMIEQYLLQNFRQKITLHAISAHLHYSTVTLTESFRRAFGCTIMQRLCEIRMNEAEQLLKSSSLGINAISEQCGFGGIEYFSKCFKQRHGIPPGEWRKTQN